MTKAQRDIVLKMVERGVSRLGLEGWEMRIEYQDTNSENLGNAGAVRGRQLGSLVFWTLPEPFEDLHQTVIHELLHIRFWRTQLGIQRAEKVLSKDTYLVLCDAFEESVEYDVDTLATALSTAFIASDRDLKRLWKKTLDKSG